MGHGHFLAVALFSLALASGCTTTSLPREALTAEGQWQASQSMIADGQTLISKAQARLEKASKQVRDGEAAAKDAEERIDRLRSDYARQSRLIGTAVTYKQIDQEGKQLRALANAWEEALDDINDGRELAKKGRKNIAKAEDDLRKGRERVAEGERMMEREQSLRTSAELPAESPVGSFQQQLR